MSYEKLGFVSGQKLKAEHLNHMEDGIANAGGVTSWNDLQDKPFGEEKALEPIVWDGNFNEANTFTIGADTIYMRISDAILTQDLLDGAKVVRYDYEEGELLFEEEDTGLTVYNLYTSQDHAYNAILAVTDKDTVNATRGTAIPANGIYSLAHPEMGSCVLSITTKETIKPLDEKYLPESVKSKGATVYYYAGKHLYHDQWENQVTKEELRAAYQLGAIYIYDNYTGGVADLHLALNVHIDDTEGYVSFIEANDTEWQTLYTAEHETLPPS